MNVAFIFISFYFDIVDENLQSFIVMIIVTEPGCLINASNENFFSFIRSQSAFLHHDFFFFSYARRIFSLVFSYSLPFSTFFSVRAHSTSSYLTSTPLLAHSSFKVYAMSNIKQKKRLFWLWKMKIKRTNSWNKFQLQLFWELMNNATAAAAAATSKRGIFL